jgi:hypothetical protein
VRRPCCSPFVFLSVPHLQNLTCYRFPVKRAQHGGRFDAVDYEQGASSLRSKSPPRRSQQTVQDLTAMNTQDHVQRSMQRQGSMVLTAGSDSKQEMPGRPIFTVNDFSATAVHPSSARAFTKTSTFTSSPVSSPRVGTSNSAKQQLPRRPHTAHHSRSRQPPQLFVSLTGDLTAPASPSCNGAIAAPQTPDAGSLLDSTSVHSPAQPAPTSSHQVARATASPPSSSRGKR